ncbi:MAG TPA: hypothetical protein VMB51_08115 [Solirubrobacteraceae bacterium]|nr:hypothetical protein [Solirubrobacteraceae bacterium]
MRHLRMLGLCLVAVLAVVAISATSASAKLPEFGQCYAKAGGKYANSSCTEKAKKGQGAYEWRKAAQVAHKKFVGSAGAGVLEGSYFFCVGEKGDQPRTGRPCKPGYEEEVEFLEKPITVECESEANHGEINGSNTVGDVSVTFKGCKLLGTAPCSNTEKEGEIHVNELKGEIGFINKGTSPREVGLQLTPAQNKGRFAQFECLGFVTTVVGVGSKKEGCAYTETKLCGDDRIIGTVTPVNEETPSLTQTFKINEETQENEPSKLEGKPRASLESFIYNTEEPQYTSQWSKAGETVTNIAVGEEEGEIKAN